MLLDATPVKMKEPLDRSQIGNTILLFGPQALSFQEESFHRLRSFLFDSPARQWVLDTITELPAHWKHFAQSSHKLQAIPGEDLLGDLNVWFQTGKITQQCSQLPNILLSPLVVIDQLTQYASYLRFASGGPGEQHDPHALAHPNVETLGFCTGLLSALAVSSSGNKDEFRHYGAVAIRLAMLIGAVVDAQDASDPHGTSQSLATVWTSAEEGEEITRMLQQFPEVYIILRLHHAEGLTRKTNISRLMSPFVMIRIGPPSPRLRTLHLLCKANSRPLLSSSKKLACEGAFTAPATKKI